MAIIRHAVVATTLCMIATAPALADSFTFNVTNGVWNEASNWSPTSGPPAAGDTAEIPTGRTCRVEDDDQACKTLEVYGTLKVDDKTLTIDADGSGYLDVDGTVEFLQSATLEVPENLSCSGDGTIQAIDGGTVTIDADNGTGYAWLIIEELTFKGSIEVLAYIRFDATVKFVVDDADDDMEIGQADSGGLATTVYIQGDGNFEVSAGSLRFGKSAPDIGECNPFDGKMKVSGGTMQVTSYAQTAWGNCKPNVEVSGGTLSISQSFGTKGTLIFSGGTITVAQDKLGIFHKPS